MPNHASSSKNFSEPGTPKKNVTKDRHEETAFRCRHFRHDRPCRFHKKEGVHCSSCTHKDLADQRLLVIKLDSPGDVLRTTCLLPSLERVYAKAHITWLTRESSRPLLENNPAIERIIDRWEEMLAILRTEYFDVAINPDATPQAARLLQLADAGDKLGMGWSRAGHVLCCNREAEQWLQMGLFDDLKRQNRETYQTLIHRLCRLELVDPAPLLFLTDGERRFAGEYLQSLGVDRHLPVIGLNTGAGSRWSRKSWTPEHLIRLIHLAKSQHPLWQLLLLGGPEEVERNRMLEEQCRDLVVNTGHHQMREFAALVEQTHLLLAADTLALHVGLALNRQIVALFGPTSHAEIDLCDRGEKLFAELDCLGCYLNDCHKSPNCMDLLAPETVFSAIERGLRIKFGERF